MKRILAVLLIAGSGVVQADIGTSKFCPLLGRDIASLRKVVSAEATNQGDPLREAWDFVEEFSSSSKNEISPVRMGRFRRFKSFLESQKKPTWYTNILLTETSFAHEVGDDVFIRQKESLETQNIKALALLYTADAKSGSLTGDLLAIDVMARLLRHTPWDWEVREVYSRTLWSLGRRSEAWFQARMAAYLNPSPQLWQLEQLEKMAQLVVPGEWDQIEKMIDDTADDLAVRSVVKGMIERARQSPAGPS